jgi:anti-sigma regulatory factor (Ser/Thr protein kinase)
VNSRPAHPRPAGDSTTREELETTREELELAAIPSAAGLVRRFTEACLHKRDLDEIADTASLVASELVTNSIRATGITEIPVNYARLHDPELARITVRLRISTSSLLIEVRDEDTRPPVPARPDALDEGGRGLILVTALTAAWGHYPFPGGKVVWAEIAVPARPAPGGPRDAPVPVAARAPG